MSYHTVDYYVNYDFYVDSKKTGTYMFPGGIVPTKSIYMYQIAETKYLVLPESKTLYILKKNDVIHEKIENIGLNINGLFKYKNTIFVYDNHENIIEWNSNFQFNNGSVRPNGNLVDIANIYANYFLNCRSLAHIL